MRRNFKNFKRTPRLRDQTTECFHIGTTFFSSPCHIQYEAGGRDRKQQVLPQESGSETARLVIMTDQPTDGRKVSLHITINNIK